MELFIALIIIGVVLHFAEKDRNNCEPNREMEDMLKENRLNRMREDRGEMQDIIDTCMGINHDHYDPSYAYSIPQHYIAYEDFHMKPLYGANSITITVLRGVKFLGGELGHNKLIFEEDQTTEVSK